MDISHLKFDVCDTLLDGKSACVVERLRSAIDPNHAALWY